VADISIIDFDKFNFPADEKRGYKKPLVFAEGVEFVIVNGKIVLDRGPLENIKAGSFLGRYGTEL